MKLYHINIYKKETLNTKLRNLVFYPRVPKSTCDTEDIVTPRICLAPTIKDCITGAVLSTYMKSFIHSPEYGNLVISIYEVDTDDYLIDDFIFSDVLDECGFVPDAYITNECWYIGHKLEMKYLGLFAIKNLEIETGVPILRNWHRYESYCEPSTNIYSKVICRIIAYIDKCISCDIVKIEEPQNHYSDHINYKKVGEMYDPLSDYIVICNDQVGMQLRKKRCCNVADTYIKIRNRAGKLA